MLYERDAIVEDARINYLNQIDRFGINSEEVTIALRIWTGLQSMDSGYSPEAQDRIIRQIYAMHGITL